MRDSEAGTGVREVSSPEKRYAVESTTASVCDERWSAEADCKGSRVHLARRVVIVVSVGGGAQSSGGTALPSGVAGTRAVGTGVVGGAGRVGELMGRAVIGMDSECGRVAARAQRQPSQDSMTGHGCGRTEDLVTGRREIGRAHV